jgi:hypothetical protein
MAVEIKFKGVTPTKNSKIEVLVLLNNQIFINIEDANERNAYVYLDKETAIKLSKELRKQISLITESEANFE